MLPEDPEQPKTFTRGSIRWPVRDIRIETPPRVPDWDLARAEERLELIKDALDLVVELWPTPGYATVTLESHQWAKLRRLLLSVPELIADTQG